MFIHSYNLYSIDVLCSYKVHTRFIQLHTLWICMKCMKVPWKPINTSGKGILYGVWNGLRDILTCPRHREHAKRLDQLMNCAFGTVVRTPYNSQPVPSVQPFCLAVSSSNFSNNLIFFFWLVKGDWYGIESPNLLFKSRSRKATR